MDKTKSITKKRVYKHLSLTERQLIQRWYERSMSIRKIAKRLARSPQTISNELKRGTTNQIKGTNKVITKYFADTGQSVYERNRQNCGAKSKLYVASEFIDQACHKMMEDKWSPDAFVGFMRMQDNVSSQQTVCTKTLYNYIDAGYLSIRNHDLPIKMRLSPKKKRCRKHLKSLGKSIDERPKSIDSRSTFGHWEIDSVVGCKEKEDNALMTIVERKTRYMFTFVLDDRTEDSVSFQIKQLISDYTPTYFSEIFKTITADNGSEFSSLQKTLEHISDVYFAHPYSSWERGTNERHNGILRKFVPKGTPIYQYSKQFISAITKKINYLPRKLLNYKQPAALFLEEIQKIKVKTC